MQTSLTFAALVLIALPVTAQDKPSEGSYKVEYTFRDAESGVKARQFTMIVENGGRGSFRLGHRVPYSTGTSQVGSGGVNPLVSTQWNYLDAGVNVDCRIRDNNGRVPVHSDIEISSVVMPDKASAAPVPPTPTVAQMRISVDSAVALGKGIVIASIDDPSAPRKFDVEVLVTRQN